jgi:hypothetical protein
MRRVLAGMAVLLGAVTAHAMAQGAWDVTAGSMGAVAVVLWMRSIAPRLWLPRYAYCVDRVEHALHRAFFVMSTGYLAAAVVVGASAPLVGGLVLVWVAAAVAVAHAVPSLRLRNLG